VANINNNSTDATPTAPAYSDFTSVVGNMTAGQSYPISVGVSSAIAQGYNTDQVLAWIDFNHDFDFDDVGEQVFMSAIQATATYTGTINIPAGATVGQTRMRIRLHDTYTGTNYVNNINATPCGIASYGEVEDYTINIAGGGGGTPPNDDCGGAVAAALSTPGSITQSGNNTGATVDPPTQYVMVWEAFTISQCSNVTINFCQSGSEFTAFFASIANSCPVDFLAGIINGGNDECNVYFFGLEAGTYYIPVRVETDGSTPIGAYTIAVSAEPCANPGPYCEAGADDLVEEKISNVMFAGIDNSSTSVAGFEDFTNVAAQVVGGSSYPLSITVAGGYSTDQGIVWVDWNQDSDFDDAGEQVFISAAGVGPYTGSVNVPLTASLGQTRMRVRLHDTYTGPNYANTPNATPCGNSTYGQVEDYTVDVIGVITGMDQSTIAAWGIYPNPNDGDMTIRYAGRDGRVSIDVLDMAGRVVFADQRSMAGNSNQTLSLAGALAPGSYVVRLTHPGGREEQRIVVR
jgi:hypothetical protein